MNKNSNAEYEIQHYGFSIEQLTQQRKYIIQNQNHSTSSILTYLINRPTNFIKMKSNEYKNTRQFGVPKN